MLTKGEVDMKKANEGEAVDTAKAPGDEQPHQAATVEINDATTPAIELPNQSEDKSAVTEKNVQAASGEPTSEGETINA